MMEDVGSAQLDLIRRIQARDQQAFGLFYDCLAPLVNAVILRLLGDPAEAEEVLMETFWQVWNEAASYDPLRGTVEGWVIMLARSRALDRLRRRRRQGTHSASYQAEQQRVLPSPHTTPETTALQDERARAITAALAALPEEQRLPLELAYYQGWSQSEIAQHLAQPLGTIKTRLRSGLVRLRHALEPYLGVRP
jgi:RNA polymerase sigma-70 factor (ECF subfamily)